MTDDDITADDQELALIAAGWEKLDDAKWIHPRHTYAGRCRRRTTAEAVIDQEQHETKTERAGRRI